jgi:mRNA-degrading endonuclease RelE of RelBE toxin-antitoxin system
MKIKYNKTDSFQKDLKRLLRKYQTLGDDLETAKRNAIELYHLKSVNNQSVFPIQGFCSETIQICKIRKFACKALKGQGSKSGIRVIYAFHCENCTVDFIEIYFKGEKENEDRDRIKEYLKNFKAARPALQGMKFGGGGIMILFKIGSQNTRFFLWKTWVALSAISIKLKIQV